MIEQLIFIGRVVIMNPLGNLYLLIDKSDNNKKLTYCCLILRLL
jgi:hypothetical protein